jgi:uncharacterized HAD superfamily protein
MKNSIVVDLDGTLCNCDHRVSFVRAQQYDEFNSRLVDDKPHEEVIRVIERLAMSHHIIVATGRSDKYKEPTQTWFSRHNIIVDALLMRPEGNHIPDHELKPQLLYSYFEGGKEEALKSVLVVLEDRDKVVAAWRNEGFPCWQVRKGNY